jgi:hypothetical protein
MSALRSFSRLVVVGAFAIVLGCGRSDPYATVPVSGVATCNGKPIANGVVNFTPLPDQEGRSEGNRGRVALGKTDSEGRFTLTTYQNNDGAISGRHTVTVSMGFSEEGGSVVDKNFPCRSSSEEATVKAGMGEIKIEFGTKK